MPEHIKDIPEHVHTRMRAMLVPALATARTKEPIGDGLMISLDVEEEVEGGMWQSGGWSLSVVYVCDARIKEWVEPSVVIHAYSGSSISKGYIAEPVRYTSEDRKALARKRLAALEKGRAEIDAEIADVRAELE